MILIIPAILATNEQEYSEQLDKIVNSGEFDEGWVHIDFMDNKFVPNKSIEPETVGKFLLDLNKEAHLMVQAPNIQEYVNQGFKRIIFHIEAVEDPSTSLRMTKDKGVEVGLAINLNTPVSKLEEYLSKVDEIVVMGIDPGVQGRHFHEDALAKVKELVKIRTEKGLSFKIAVDGGVHPDTIKGIIESGVEILIIGSALLEGDVKENLESIWEAAY